MRARRRQHGCHRRCHIAGQTERRRPAPPAARDLRPPCSRSSTSIRRPNGAATWSRNSPASRGAVRARRLRRPHAARARDRRVVPRALRQPDVRLRPPERRRGRLLAVPPDRVGPAARPSRARPPARSSRTTCCSRRASPRRSRHLERESPFDVVYLGTSSRNISERRRTRVGSLWAHEPVGTVFNTWGYVVTRAYVERFFATPEPAHRPPIDHFLGGSARRARPRIAVLQPAVVTEDEVLADAIADRAAHTPSRPLEARRAHASPPAVRPASATCTRRSTVAVSAGGPAPSEARVIAVQWPAGNSRVGDCVPRSVPTPRRPPSGALTRRSRPAARVGRTMPTVPTVLLPPDCRLWPPRAATFATQPPPGRQSTGISDRPADRA